MFPQFFTPCKINLKKSSKIFKTTFHPLKMSAILKLPAQFFNKHFTATLKQFVHFFTSIKVKRENDYPHMTFSPRQIDDEVK